MKHIIQKEYSKITEKIIMFFYTIFLVVFGWFFINCLFNNSNDLVHYNMRVISIIALILFGILSFLFIQIDRGKISEYLDGISKNKKIFALIFFCICIFMMQVFITKSFYYDIGWDAKVLIDSGEQLATNPALFVYDYFNFFPNNIFLAFIYKYIYYISEVLGIISYRFLLVVINIICVDIAIIMTVVIANKIFNKSVAAITGILSLVLIIFSPWLIVAYSDTLSMMFPILLFYLYLKIKEVDNILIKINLSFFSGILGVIGFQIKPTAIIIIIAIIISTLLFNLKDKKSLTVILASILFMCIGGCGTKIIYKRYIGNMNVNGVVLNENENIEVPMTHFLMMGLQERYIEDRGTLYGAWNIDDYNITINMPTKDERIKKNLEVYINRVKKLGFLGYVRYLSAKGNWMLSDGTFYYGGEGNFAVSESYSNTSVSKYIQSYYKFDGINYRKLASLQEAIWIIILFLIVCPILKIKKDINNENVFIIRLTITGITLFLLLFEGRSRYLLNHVPFFVLLSSYGLNSLYDFKSRKTK